MKKQTNLILRLTLKQKNKLKGLAMIYAGGNVSRWVLHQSLEAYKATYLVDPDAVKKKKK